MKYKIVWQDCSHSVIDESAFFISPPLWCLTKGFFQNQCMLSIRKVSLKWFLMQSYVTLVALSKSIIKLSQIGKHEH
jgi:hypothetical protein